VASRAKFLDTCKFEGVEDLDGVEWPDPSFGALGKRLSTCGPIIEKISLAVVTAEATLEIRAHREHAIDGWSEPSTLLDGFKFLL
jgi:hypothetical protein